MSYNTSYNTNNHLISFSDLPSNASPTSINLFKTRLDNTLNKFAEENKFEKLSLNISFNNNLETNKKEPTKEDPIVKDRSINYHSQSPLYKLEQFVIPNYIKKELISALELINLREKVFEEWGLSQIEPNPRIALNFHGNPGTGKTLAAHAIASKIGCNIMIASYANIESMYHGEGPKNVEALFYAATKENALLFIDEADSLLSKRLTNVTQGSEQAINSMRSQLLICLENFKGVVIFATNLVENYDKAFETRVKNIYFPLPDFECRKIIWQKHFVEKLPLSNDVNIETLAKIDDVCGRDIKNAVIQAAINARFNGKDFLELQDFIDSIHSIKNARIQEVKTERQLSDEELKMFKKIDFKEMNNSHKHSV